MAKRTIEQNVKIKYMSEGLDQIQKEIQKLKPVMGRKKDKKQLEEFEGKMIRLSKLMDNIGENPIDPDTLKAFQSEFGNILKTLKSQWQKTLSAQEQDFSTSVDLISEKIDQLSTEIIKLEKEAKPLETAFRDTKETDKDLTTTKTYQRQLEEEIFSSLKDQNQVAKEIYSYAGNQVEKTHHLGELKDKLLKDAQMLNEEERKLVENFIETGEETEKTSKAFERLAEFSKSKLNHERMMQGLVQQRLVSQEVEKRTQEDHNKLLELRSQISERQTTLSTEQAELEQHIQDLKDKQTTATTREENDLLEVSQRLLSTYTELMRKHNEELQTNARNQDDTNRSKKTFNREAKRATTTLGKATQQVFSYGLAFTFLRRIYRETIRTIRDLDSALTEMAIVTTMNREETWKLADTMQDLAKETGFTTTEIAKLSTVYFRQGRALKDVIELTRVAAMAARVAGISAAESADYLTSAVNGFGLAANEALAVSDKFAALGASSASSFEELAVGLSKFAAQANVAGLSIDYAMGFLAKGVETTREAPETIGTALKTVLARMRELTDYGRTLEDGMDVSRVETALRQIDVSLRDVTGSFRPMSEVLEEIGWKWESLNTNQRASVAVALAGTRQQSRLLAVMQDFDRTMELVDISQESAGATTAQHVEHMKSMEAAMVGLQTAWQEFIRTISESELIIDIVKGLSTILTGVSKAITSMGLAGKNMMIIFMSLAAALKFKNLILKMTGGLWSKVTSEVVKNTVAEGINKNLTAKQIKLQIIKNTHKAKYGAIAAVQNAQTMTEINLAILKYKWDNLLIGLMLIKEKILLKLNALQARYIVLQHLKTAATTLSNIVTAAYNKTLGVLITRKTILGKLLIGLSKGLILFAKGIWFLMTPVKVATIAFIKFWLALLGPVGLVIAGIAAIGAGIYGLVKLFQRFGKESKKSFKELNKEIIAANYELNRHNREIQNLIDSYDELSKKKIHTQEDIEAMRELEEQMKDLIGEENITYTVTVQGDRVMNWEETRRTMERIRKNQEKEIRDNLRDLYEAASEEVQKYRILEDHKIIEEGNIFRDNADIRRAYSNHIISMYNYAFEEIDRGTQKTVEDFLHNSMINNPKEWSDQDLEEFVHNELKGIIGVIEQANDEIMNPSREFAENMEIFRNMYKTIEDENQKEILRSHFNDIITLFENFNDSFHGNAKEFFQILDDLGLSDRALSQEFVARLGQDSTQVIAAVNERIEYLMKEHGMHAESARAKAWRDLAKEIDKDNPLRQFYMNMAEAYSGLEVAQQLDRITSSLDNLYDSQQKFQSGELGYQEIYDFFENFPHLFNTIEDVEAFLSGERIDAKIFQEKIEMERQAIVGLQDAMDRMREAEEGSNEFKSALKDYAMYKALLEYRGALNSTTAEQQNYNRSLETYNRLQEMGIENEEVLKQLRQDQINFLETQLNLHDQNIKSIIEGFGEISDTLKDEGYEFTEFEDFFEIVNGQVVPMYDNLDGLSATLLNSLEQYADELQNELNNSWDTFNDLRKQYLEEERKDLDRQKDAYEKYFERLDRLQNQRNRQQSREDIVQQLQRLEGATDERSRQRALELRKELNQLDEDSAEERQAQARQALLDSFDERYEELEEKWALAGQQFINDMAEGGAVAGTALVNELVKAGLIKEEDTQDSSTGESSRSGGTGTQIQSGDPSGDYKTSEISDADFEENITNIEGNNLEEATNRELEIWRAFIKLKEHMEKGSWRRGTGLERGKSLSDVLVALESNYSDIEGKSGRQIYDVLKDLDDAPVGYAASGLKSASHKARRWNKAFSDDKELIRLADLYNIPNFVGEEQFRRERDRVPKFKKGGFVDFTGMAELHGTPSRPEAVLSAKQTEMFIGLTHALEKLQLNHRLNENSGGINIEKIEIKTDHLNNAQDFDRAGQALAKAFGDSINRRGITVNTRR